jgi:hypothetical protein
MGTENIAVVDDDPQKLPSPVNHPGSISVSAQMGSPLSRGLFAVQLAKAVQASNPLYRLCL